MATAVVSVKAGNWDNAARRRYKRNYMRRWRADPRHYDRERASRERSYYNRKVRNRRRSRNVCGFCHQRPPKSKVLRLMPVEEGFIPIFVPYCGHC